MTINGYDPSNGDAGFHALMSSTLFRDVDNKTLIDRAWRNYSARPPTSQAPPSLFTEMPETPEGWAPSTWADVDLTAILDGTYKRRVPTLMPREDGVFLLYPGLVHSFHGESESGKSMLAQIEVARVLINGGTATYVDFESDSETVTMRLVDDLGVPAELMRKNFGYKRPESNPFRNGDPEYRTLLANPRDIIIIDGVTDALGVFGAESSNNNDDIAGWLRKFARPLAEQSGAAVVLIDHVVKNAENRGRFALGGQAKMNGLDGAAYTIEVKKPLGRGMRGAISMRCGKDRPGSVRPHCGAFRASDRTQEAAYVIVDSSGQDQKIHYEFRAPLADLSNESRHMEAISKWLEAQTGPVSQTKITDAIEGRVTEVRYAINKLIASGYVHLEARAGRNEHTSLKPYRAVPIELNWDDEE